MLKARPTSLDGQNEVDPTLAGPDDKRHRRGRLASAGNGQVFIEEAALHRIAEHCKNLYDEETMRMVRINEGARLDRVILGAVLGLVAAVRLPFHAVRLPAQDHFSSQIIAVAGILFLLAGGVALIVSCVYTFRVLIVRKFQRPCDPEVFFARSAISGTSTGVVLKVISNYAVAANRNHRMNNNKVEAHSRAVTWLTIGMVLAFIGVCICGAMNAIK